MRRMLALATLALGGFVARSAAAGTSVTVGPAGGLDALAVTVDAAGKLVRYASCKGTPCAVTAASPGEPIPSDLPIDEKAVSVRDVALGAGRHLVHVRVPLGADAGPEAPAWEMLLAAGAPPLFAGRTGWTHGETGERSGVLVRWLTEGEHSVAVIGEIREDLRICGDGATLLEPRGLDPRTLVFHGATLQRMGAARRDAAIAIPAAARRGPREPALAPLLTATDASSALGSAAALTDGDVTTAWSEARPGRGQGEFVLLRTPFDVPIVRFAVTVAPSTPKGAGAAPETFYLATNTATYEVTLPEDAWSHPGEAYDIPLPSPLQTSCVALVLGDAFARGKAHPEVSVTELTAYSAFDHPGATLAEVATALRGGDARAQAAAALLEQAGAPGVLAMSTSYTTLDPPGRALAINIAASAMSCASSGTLLAAALTDADEVVRTKAATKLHEPSCGHQALPSLIAALGEPSARAKVAPLVALIGRDGALGPLAGVLGEGTADDRDAVRSAVAHAAEDATPAALSALLATTAARSPDARLELLRALSARLGEVAPPADANIAVLLAGAPTFATRYALVDVIAQLASTSDKEAQARLADLALQDPSREVRARTTERLAKAVDPDAIAAKALRDAEPRVREAALHAIGALHQSNQIPAITDLLAHDPWTFVRVAAAEALATLPVTPPSDRALERALEQLSPRVRQRAALALGVRNARGSADALRARLTDVKEEPTVRTTAAHALGLLCDAKATDLLTRMAVDGGSSPDASDVSLGLVATAALGTIHPSDLESRFAPLRAKGVRPDARAAAERALSEPVRCLGGPLPQRSP